MTKEEAIRIAQGLITDFKCESETMVEFCNVVIKALEQGNVLDKIRAEIIAESFPEDDEYSLSNMVYLKDVLDILDKYKAESEV